GEAEMTAGYMSILIRRAVKTVLDREINSTQLHEFAKERIFEKESLEVALEILGKKAATSLIRYEESKIDLQRLKLIHEKAFSE
ncbi:MAG TPA: hypothetical protein V6C96_00090, partial [Vampirovibrionales bacterium]